MYFRTSIDESSFQFGKDWSVEWITGGAQFFCILKVAVLTRKENVFEDLYRLVGEKIEPIEAYEETFQEQEDGEMD